MNTTLLAKFTTLRTHLHQTLIERSGPIDSSLAAVLAEEHVFFLGQPGSAKSALARAISGAIDGGRYFETLLGRFSLIDEIAGPVSLKSLEDGKFERQIQGYAPTAEILFLDEIYKASSSLLNCLLSLLNERKFNNDGRMIPCPLISCFSASNEMPESVELNAIFDRFLVRHQIGYISDRDNLKAMLTAADPVSPHGLLTLDEVRLAQADVLTVAIPDATLELVLDAKQALERAGIVASDRRWKRCLRYLRAVAWLEGDAEVREDHIDALSDCLWREVKEKATVVQCIGQIANPVAAKALEILDAARETHRNIVVVDVVTTDRTKYLGQIAEANNHLGEALKKLRGLTTSDAPASRVKKVAKAVEEVAKLHEDIGRRAAKVLGLRS